MAALLHQDGAKCVIHYGSSLQTPRAANDIDIVAIYPDDQTPANFQLIDFDITRLSKQEFDHYCQVLNPVYCTEPCLTGECISGDPELLEDTTEELVNQSPSQQAINHNLNRSIEAFQDCVEALQAGDAAYTARRLPFVASYWLFATWYEEGKQPTTLEQVRRQTEPSGVITDVFELANRSEDQSVATATVADHLYRWQEFMLLSRLDVSATS